MKNLCFLLLLALTTSAFAQSQTVRLYVHLKYEDGTPYANSLVYLKNLNNDAIVDLRTDYEGKLKYRPATGTSYELQLKKGESFTTIKIPKRSKALVTHTFTLNKADFPYSPSDTIYQNISPRTLPSHAFGIAEIFIGDRHRKPVRNIEVRLHDKKAGKTYITTTTNTGKAFFLVPNNTTYAVGIEHLDRYKVITVPDEPGVYFETGFLFVPTEIQETLEKDTIRQDLPTNTDATSARALVRIFVKNYEGVPLANEQIALNPRDDSLTYLGYTNDRGIVEFLLPVGMQYVLHFYYERNIDLLDFRAKRGLHKANIQYTYVGTAAIQKFYAEADRDKFGFLKEFREVPIEPLAFEETNYFTPTKDGFVIDFKRDKGPINTPTVANDKVYMSSGYYSSDLYVYDLKTKGFNWGVSLTEGGPSTIVYEDGILLVITQSCTLYAIDADNGELVWSKYLAPNMYSTPTVHNGKVIATYPNGLAVADLFVLGCFDLKTGKIEWQKPLDAEAIAAPVAFQDKIYTATTSGTLYQHNLADGERLQMDSLKAVTPPTVVDGTIYIGVHHKKSQQHLVKVAIDDFNVKTSLNALAAPFTKQSKEAFTRMNFNGIRPLHYKGSNFQVLKNKLVRSDSDGKIIWQSPIKGDTDSTSIYNIMPIVANNTIVATKGSHIQLFNADTGELIKGYTIQGEALTQPAIHKGILYSGSHEQRMIVIDTKDKTLTGWNMWNGNGSHNTYVED